MAQQVDANGKVVGADPGPAPTPGTLTTTWNNPAIDPNAYKSAAGDQGANWQAGMANYLGATTGAAPQMGQVNLGQAYQSGGVNLGPTATYGGAQIQGNQYNQTYGAEGALANQLAMQAQGHGPSIAQVTAQQQAGQNLSNQMAMLGSQRGSGNPALAAYQAQQAGSQAQQQAAQQAVLGRTQEQLGAQQQYASLLGGMNGQAQGFATNQAQMQQQAGLASMGALNQGNQYGAQLGQQNQQFNVGNQNSFAQMQAQLAQQANSANVSSQLSQNSLNAQQYNNYMAQLAAVNAQNQQGAMAAQGQMSSNALTAAGINAGTAIAQANNAVQLGGAGASAASALLGYAGTSPSGSTSDRKAKTNIHSGHKELNKFLDDLFQSNSMISLSL